MGVIDWKFFTALLEIQENIGLRFANKLSRSHINFLNNKMKVKYAVQTFSSSVADAMEVLQLLKVEEFQNCEATVEFIRILDRVFDFLNSRNPRGTGYKRPIRLPEVPYYERKVEEWTRYLYSLTDGEGTPLHLTKRKTFIFGLATSLKSVLAVSIRLLKTPFFRLVILRSS